ncbi:uncharacterized protein LOC112558143 isoform X2 [Pomacea canaliculata]|uniref:uncharacterized protein LOC112558143 isoform X2 n=1 Tax=Pomacea canaliculata TaxID=400727 RepID=UPI000D73EC75|nr:uncharacterized protein LOC112558143 isoform X2 [Pomacea canaliculata]
MIGDDHPALLYFGTDFMKQLDWSFYYKITTETNILGVFRTPSCCLEPNPHTLNPHTKATKRGGAGEGKPAVGGQATGMRGNFPCKKKPTQYHARASCDRSAGWCSFQEILQLWLACAKSHTFSKESKIHSLSENVAPGEDTTAAIR